MENELSSEMPSFSKSFFFVFKGSVYYHTGSNLYLHRIINIRLIKSEYSGATLSVFAFDLVDNSASKCPNQTEER